MTSALFVFIVGVILGALAVAALRPAARRHVPNPLTPRRKRLAAMIHHLGDHAARMGLSPDADELYALAARVDHAADQQDLKPAP